MHVEPGQPLDVTLAWTDFAALPPAGTPTLINNLDLTVTGPGGTYVGNNMNTRTTPGSEQQLARWTVRPRLVRPRPT